MRLVMNLRCVRPIAYDLSYATQLGTGVMKLFQDGRIRLHGNSYSQRRYRAPLYERCGR